MILPVPDATAAASEHALGTVRQAIYQYFQVFLKLPTIKIKNHIHLL